VIRGWRAATLAVLGVVTISGCGFTGAYSLPLPGGAAHRPTYDVTAVFADVQDLTPQAAVRVNDVAVGDVTAITVGSDLKAHVVMKIDASVHLPANAVATLDQTSQLGEKFVALAAPGDGVPSRGRLVNGAVLQDGSTATLPDVEQVFGLLSNVLNGGDLGDLQTITVELTKALSGREGAVRDVLSQLDTFVSALNGQKHQIVRALNQLDRLTGTLRQSDTTIATALDELGPGLKVLADERTQFTGPPGSSTPAGRTPSPGCAISSRSFITWRRRGRTFRARSRSSSPSPSPVTSTAPHPGTTRTFRPTSTSVRLSARCSRPSNRSREAGRWAGSSRCRRGSPRPRRPCSRSCWTGSTTATAPRTARRRPGPRTTDLVAAGQGLDPAPRVGWAASCRLRSPRRRDSAACSAACSCPRWGVPDDPARRQGPARGVCRADRAGRDLCRG
jgi:virulence factor Mce-like protein